MRFRKGTAIGFCLLALALGASAEAEGAGRNGSGQVISSVSAGGISGKSGDARQETKRPSETIDTEINQAEVEKAGAVRKQEIVGGKKIVLNLAGHLLTLYDGDKKIRMYPVAIGALDTPSPTGNFSITEKVVNPSWTDPETEKTVESGPACPLGYRWMRLFGNYGIHGTNAPWSIGNSVSHGCIRMHEEDVEDLYDQVKLGTPVEIQYERVIIEREPDHTISYYIYPDGYGQQPLSVDSVKKVLAGYGVEDFAAPDSIYGKIMASDGTQTYVAKAYDLFIDGKKLSKRALGKDGNIWLPAVAVSVAAKTGAYWDGESNVLMSRYGKVPGIVKSDVVYINEKDMDKVFPLEGRLTDKLVYEARIVPERIQKKVIRLPAIRRPAEMKPEKQK